MELDDQQYEKFARAYVYETNGNATAAAKRAGYGEKSAYQQGWRLSKKVEVRERIREIRMEALRESGYDKESVRRIITERLISIVMTKLTDVVNISPGMDDPNRAEVLDSLARMNGGQRALDFGEVLVAPTAGMSECAQMAIKKICPETGKSGLVSMNIEMHDPIAAARTLASILGIGDADTQVLVSVGVSEELERARRRAAEANGRGAEESRDD
jgi:hypothetical protein